MAVGILSTSDTGLQEVACLLAREGVAVSKGIGTESRDLSLETGGDRMLDGLRSLQSDPDTEVIVLIAGTPALGAARRVLDRVRSSDKPTVVCFMGIDRHLAWRAGAIPASRLDEASMRAAAWVRGWDQALISSRLADLDEQLAAQALKLRAGIGSGRRQLLGLLSSGLFCHEAQLMLADVTGESVEATFRDLGAEGDVHSRFQLLQEAFANPEIAVVLLDVGLNDADSQGPALGKVLRKRREGALVLAHICGVGVEVQRLSRLEARLRAEGIVLAPSNAAAARLGGMVLAELDRDQPA